MEKETVDKNWRRKTKVGRLYVINANEKGKHYFHCFNWNNEEKEMEQ